MIESLEALTKIPLYAGLLVLIGVCTMLWLVRNGGSPGPPGAALQRPMLGVKAGAVVVLFLFLRLLAHTHATFGSDAWTFDSIFTIALKSRWGQPWQMQLLVALVATGAVAWARAGSRMSAVGASLLAIALAIAYSRMGHSAGSATTSLTAAAHMIAGGAWLGTLAVLVVERHEGALWARFSPVAMLGSATIVISGLVLALHYISAPSELLSTLYGRVLLLKQAFFSGIAMCGFVNWRRVRVAGAPSTARLELALAVALVVVTSFLTEIAHP